MSTASPVLDERARKNNSLILRTLAKVTQARVAERMCLSETTISRMNEDYFMRVAELMAALGLKLVPEEQECWDPGYIAKLRSVLAVELLNNGNAGERQPFDG